MWRFLAEAAAVFVKDLRSEFRTKVALNALGLFAVTTLAAVSYTIGPYRIAEADRPFLLSALLWIVIFFAAMAGLDRSFVKEEDTHTAPLLRLSADPLVVWAGKLVFNLVLLAVLMAILVPLYIVLMGFHVSSPLALFAVLMAGGYTLGVTTTMVAAIIARAMTRGALFSVLSLPLLLPLMIFLIQGTRAAAEGSPDGVTQTLRAVISLGGVMTVVSVILFPVVWHE
ncbi:MAG: heme ABC transporter permease CcmB [Acidobacteria bacterium]|nr:heme ABC transporter permease CcmB [Acidobacteriota bacterium]